jgi:hypothetical protein
MTELKNISMSTFCAHLKKEEVNGQKQKQFF